MESDFYSLIKVVKEAWLRETGRGKWVSLFLDIRKTRLAVALKKTG
jgi:hypothetical protein